MIVTAPPVLTLFAPTVMAMAPLLPCVEVPVPILMLPDGPFVVVPDANVRDPLIPSPPAARVRMTMDPLVDAVPDPPIMEIAPPVAPLPEPAVMSMEPPWPVATVVASVLLPATIDSLPPAFLLPLPTVMLTAPPAPLAVVVPLPIDIEPELPELDVPELNTSIPLIPAVPAFTERIMTDPLDVAVPDPDRMVMVPPVSVVPTPPARSSIPPPCVVARPWPAVIDTPPPR